MRKAIMATAAAVGVLACGGKSNNPPPSNSDSGTVNADSGVANPDSGTVTHTATLTIHAFSYSPANLTVAPGTVITVVNQDTTLHSVTSETTANTFVPGAVNGISFDTGAFTGQATITIPSTATAGTVIPYYCTVHLQMMANNGQITVQTQ